MKYVSSRLKLSIGCQRVKHGPRTILLKLLTILLSGSPFRWWTRQQQTAGPIRQQSLLRKLTLLVRHRFRVTNAKIAALAGTNQFQMFATVSIKKNSLGNKDQVISSRNAATVAGRRAPDPGPNRKTRTASRGGRAPGYITFFRNGSGWCVRYDKNAKPQAASVKHQAPIFRKKTLTKLANS